MIYEHDFTQPDYLSRGSQRQKEAFLILVQNGVMEKLEAYQPILTGTIPIGIDIPQSDLDIICYVQNENDFIDRTRMYFGKMDGFNIQKVQVSIPPAAVVSFRVSGFEVELFGQNTPTVEQMAYRHMLVEARLLCELGEDFRQSIIRLKNDGYKTEPAFAIALDIPGNPFEALLKLEDPLIFRQICQRYKLFYS